MNAKDTLKQALATTNMVVSSYLQDLTDADLLIPPAPGCNHIAWQLGHLIQSNVSILESIAPGLAPKLPEGFGEKHTKETAQSVDPAAFHSKAEYEALMQKVNDSVVAAIDKMSESDLDQPSPEHWRSMFPRVGDIVVLLTSHAMMHAGQWVPLRRKLNKPVVI
jgi:hypothetical protein